METVVATFTILFARLNEVLSSAIIILAFSLFAYILVYNFRSAIGRGFAVILACMCFTYVGDVALFQVHSVNSAVPWLKFQWIGIAFTPAAYLHFSDVLLRTTNAVSRRRRFAVYIAYLFGFVLLLLAVYSDQLVRNAFYLPGITQFRAGPFFWVFTIYFYTTVGWGVYKVIRARARCLTSGARRRMTYLAVSFVAPALGVFPYMLTANTTSLLPPLLLFITLFLANLGIALMITVMAYSVIFFGALSPDRVIKHRLIHFLLRGPLVTAIVIAIIQALPEQERLLGLPRDIILATSIVAVIVLAPLMISLAKPLIDGLIFYHDRHEIAWISELDRRLLTTSDLQQILENLLTTLCEILRVRTGFVYNLSTRQGPRLETQIGLAEKVKRALADIDVPKLVGQKNGHGGRHFIIQNNFWFIILKNQAGDRSLGLLGVEARAAEYDLNPDEEEVATLIIEQAERALEDRRLQQDVFLSLKNIIPDIDRVQRLQGAVSYAGAPNVASLTTSLFQEQDFAQMVRDALSHYWGGPKLTGSPLLELNVVQESLDENDGNPVKALRAVLNQAIEKQRPEGERRMTTAEWLIYNILDLKFIQGLRVRDIAHRLAMSEADLYRKQRLAIEEVARTLSEMEAQGQKETPDPIPSSVAS
jgi:hypothetical protein